MVDDLGAILREQRKDPAVSCRPTVHNRLGCFARNTAVTKRLPACVLQHFMLFLGSLSYLCLSYMPQFIIPTHPSCNILAIDFILYQFTFYLGDYP
jgi:hypothetical protein